MANGRGTRWDDHLGVPKHLVEIDGETLLRRLVRQVATVDPDADIVISASDPRYETVGARRHVPLVNEIELDRFPLELVVDDVCFLYGDTVYSDAAIAAILSAPANELDFFGDERAIVAVRCARAEVLLGELSRVRQLYLSGAISTCIGWQVYQSYEGLPFGPVVLGPRFRVVTEPTAGFNTPEDLAAFLAGREETLDRHG